MRPISHTQSAALSTSCTPSIKRQIFAKASAPGLLKRHDIRLYLRAYRLQIYMGRFMLIRYYYQAQAASELQRIFRQEPPPRPRAHYALIYSDEAVYDIEMAMVADDFTTLPTGHAGAVVGRRFNGGGASRFEDIYVFFGRRPDMPMPQAWPPLL